MKTHNILNIKKLHLNIVGKGTDVVKMQKRLRCAARATGNELVLTWQHEDPQSTGVPTKNAVAVMADDRLVIDGLKTTEAIEKILKELSCNQ